MREFIDFLKNKGIIQRLKKDYKIDQQNSEESEFINAIIEIFGHQKTNKVFGYYNNQEKVRGIDIIGNIYESKISNTQKKRLGEFYTPTHIVKHINLL